MGDKMAGVKRRSFYGWGYEDDPVSAEELGWFERAWSGTFDVDRFDAGADAACERRSRCARRGSRCRRPCGVLHHRQVRAPVPQLRPLGARPRAHDSSARFLQSARRGRLPARRSRHRRAARLVRRQRRGGDPLRRRLERGRRRQSTRRRALQRRASPSTSSTSTACSRSTRPRRRRASRRACSGPSLEQQLKPTRAHDALLPAGVGVLLARRLDRHPRRRPLRDRLHADRRPHREPARRHAGRAHRDRDGCRPPARDRAPTGCSSARKARSASSPRRGCGCTGGRRSGSRPPCAFRDYGKAVDAVRAISQAGLYPANARLIERDEAKFTEAGDGSQRPAGAVVRIRRPSARAVDEARARALRRPRRRLGRATRCRKRTRSARGAAGNWRDKFLRGPYLREHAIARGVMRDTVESCITWDRYMEFQAQVKDATLRAIREVTGPPRHVHRALHAYLSGRARALLHLARARRQGEAGRSSSGRSRPPPRHAMIDAGGTITHHHALGRDHRTVVRPASGPQLFADALKAVKKRLDPHARPQSRHPGRPLTPNDIPRARASRCPVR